MKTRWRVFVGVVGLMGLTGCNDDSETVGSTLEEACEHMAEGPATAVTAALQASEAPDVSAGHTRFDIALAADDGTYGGSVAYASGEVSDYVFFLSADVPLLVSDASGTDRAIEAREAVTACTEVVVQVTVPLGVGTYTLTFGPTDLTSVSLVAEASSHEHEEE